MARAAVAQRAVGDDAGRVLRFDPATIGSLPPPARRFLRWSLPSGTPLVDAVEIGMRGELRAGRWRPFTAQQVVVAGRGFTWRAVAGGRVLELSAIDTLRPGVGRVDVRLHGLVPVVRSTGPDVARSAAGRLAAETAIWLPQALTPQAGARWVPVDDERADVTLVVDGRPITVRLAVAPGGAPVEVSLVRWNGAASPPRDEPFGGRVHGAFTTDDGVRIARSGTVGWGWGTPGWEDQAFFRFTVTAARHRPSSQVDLDRVPRPRPRLRPLGRTSC